MDILRNLIKPSVIRPLGLGLAIALACIPAGADVADLPVKEFNGKRCHYYSVQPKETIYSITHKLGITKEELLKSNPGAADGLKSGAVLIFPVTEKTTATQSASSSSSRAGAKPSPASTGNNAGGSNDGAIPSTHTVQKGETLFGIARRYHLTANRLLELNPEAASGLKSGMTLRLTDSGTRPAGAKTPAEQPARAASDGSTRKYVILQGETLYKIARENGTSVNDILALNPGMDRNKYSAGQTILLPAAGIPAVQTKTEEHSTPAQTRQETVSAPEVRRAADGAILRYLVRDGETLYSIARAHGVTVAQLEACNPDLGVLRKGMTILIPASGAQTPGKEAGNQVMQEDSTRAATQTPQEPSSPATVPMTPLTPATPPTSTDTPAAGKETQTSLVPDLNYQTPLTANHPVKIAVALPFMASSESRPKSSQLFTEFYKGLLMAVDSLRNNGRPVYLFAYDTADNIDTLRDILARPEMKEMDALIAPDDEAQLREAAFFGRANNVPVINAFVVKDNSYRFNPAVMQCNIPHTEMYTKAIRELTSTLGGAIPVILNPKDGSDDKAEYISQLRRTLDSANIPYETISYSGRLSASDLSNLSKDGRFVFIPTTGKQAEFTKIAPALLEFRDRASKSDAVSVMGYPEWITFRGDALSNLHKLNARVYSRFYSVPEDMRTIAFDQNYSKWYGEAPANYLPNQGMLGFDLGMYLITALRAPGSTLDNPINHTPMPDLLTSYNGVQNGFRFSRLPHAGSVNDMLYFITFSPSGNVSRKMI